MPKGYMCQQRFGVVIFDEPGDIKSGWACTTESSPFYITLSGDLDPNVVWLTNVDLVATRGKSLSRTPHLKIAGYLRTPLSRIAMELGLQRYPKDRQAKVLCDLFSTIMQFYCLHTGRSSTPSEFLHNGIRHALYPDELSMPHDVRSACGAAVGQQFEKERSCIAEDAGSEPLVFHRCEHARSILEGDLPAGRWEHASSLVLNKSQSYLSEWIGDMSKPALIKVSVESASAKIDHLIEHDAWMSSIEYLGLRQHADLIVQDMYTGQGFEYSPVSVPDWGPFCDNSYAFGLYCENLWTSLTRTLDGRSAASPLSAWVLSIDRLKCLEKVIAIEASEDVVVHSYGYGCIVLRAQSADRLRLADVALRHDLITPMATEPNSTLHRLIPTDATRVELMQLAMERGAIDFIQRTNSTALNDVIERYDNIHI